MKIFIPPIGKPQAAAVPVPERVLATGVKHTVKRNYKERKISIDVQQNEQTRKFKKNLKQKIAAMPIALVKKALLKGGMIKPKKTYPPDDILRSMMKDYMSLHTIE